MQKYENKYRTKICDFTAVYSTHLVKPTVVFKSLDLPLNSSLHHPLQAIDQTFRPPSWS